MNFPRLLRTLLGRVALSLLFVVSPLILRAAETRILIYTKNQVGPGLYVHDNVATATKALQKLISDQGWVAEVSDDPATFTPAKLKTFSAIVFNNTNNEILDNEAQKTALAEFVHNGGGIVGIHSACGSMRNWPWFWSLMGGKFKRHPKLQPFTVKVLDRTDLSTAHLPAQFQWTDEFYFLDHMPEGLHILLAGDLNSLDDPQKPSGTNPLHPLSWRHEFEGGRVFFTALGHQKAHYEDSRLTKHLLGGLLWVTQHNSKSN